jgi:hypothetical protein
MAEFVEPMLTNVVMNVIARFEIGHVVPLDDFIAQYAVEWFAQPATPDVMILDNTNAKLWRAIANTPYSKFSPSDIANVQQDPIKREMYTLLVENTLLPVMRDAVTIVSTKMHLAPLFNPARLNQLLPGLGRDWGQAKGTLLNVFTEYITYARQFEAVLSRWSRDDFAALQPTQADASIFMMLVLVQMKGAVGKKEVALLGASSGKGAERQTFMTAGSVDAASSETEVSDTT